MTCLAASIPKIPVPALDLLLPTLQFGIPAVGINYCCCNFSLPFLPLSVPIPLGAIMQVPAIASALATITALILAAIDVMNSYLDQLQFSFSCPLD